MTGAANRAPPYNQGRQIHKERTMAVIDAHAHIYPDKIAAAAVDAVGDFYEVNMFGDGTAAGLLSAKDRSPITHFLVHSVATSVHAVTLI